MANKDINKQVFEKLNNKIKYYNSARFNKDVVKSLVDSGRDRLKLEYSFNLAIENVSVNGKVLTSNKGQVYATGDDVAYIEYGTGKVGEKSGYPKELLPKQAFVFESPKGVTHTLPKWEYYYYDEDNNYTKVKYKGKWGWFYNGLFTRGMPAGKQMYDTARYLRQNVVPIIKNAIKGKVE